MEIEWITFTPRGDTRGGMLVAIESGRDIPFVIKRVYTLSKLASGTIRGGHAHKALRQVIVCLAGSCLIDLQDGEGARQVVLNDPARGLVLEPMVWHDLHGFSQDCMLLVLASEHFDEADYLRDHAVFLNQARSGRT